MAISSVTRLSLPLNASALGLLLALGSATGFSFKAIFVKLAYEHGVDAETLLALRVAYGLPVFLWIGVMASRQGEKALAGSDWLVLLLLGFFGYYLASYLDFLGLNYISASLERLILFSYPTMIVLLSAILLKKAITARTALALLICYAGIALAVAHDVALDGAEQETLIGVALILGSALSYSLYFLGNGHVVARIGPQNLTGWASTFACLMSLIQFFSLRPASSLIQPWEVHGYAFAMAIFSTVLPVWCLSQAIRLIGAGKVALMSNLGPILTMGFASLLLSESLGWVQLVGAGLVIGGVLLVAREKEPKPD